MFDLMWVFRSRRVLENSTRALPLVSSKVVPQSSREKMAEIF